MSKFPVGFHEFHSNQFMNFQMNRWYSSGCLSYEELMSASDLIQNFEDWTETFIRLSQKAREKNDMLACATYLRAAQFFVLDDKKDKAGELLKISLYEGCIEAYNQSYQNDDFRYVRIPIESGYIPVIYKVHDNKAKGTIVMHGGYDSFIQEFVPYMNYLYERDFNVYMFEGFGQGEVLIRCGLKMSPDWEKCTTPVLDYFQLEDVTLIGISLGGYLAARAAAFETRIKRVVLYDIIYDFYGSIMSKNPNTTRWLTEYLLKHEKCYIWNLMEKRTKKNLFADWLLKQGYYVFGVQNLREYLKHIKLYNTREISRLINQDVLLLAGSDDLYTIYFEDQKRALSSANSVEGRIFTKEDHASHHCQVGNLGLALDYIINWINGKL